MIYKFIFVTVLVLLFFMFYRMMTCENFVSSEVTPFATFDFENFSKENWSSNKYLNFTVQYERYDPEWFKNDGFLYLSHDVKEETQKRMAELRNTATLNDNFSLHAKFKINEIVSPGEVFGLPIIVHKPSTEIGSYFIQKTITIDKDFTTDSPLGLSINLNYKKMKEFVGNQQQIQLVTNEDAIIGWTKQSSFNYIFLTTDSTNHFMSLNPHALSVDNRHVIIQICFGIPQSYGNETVIPTVFKIFIDGFEDDDLVDFSSPYSKLALFQDAFSFEEVSEEYISKTGDYSYSFFMSPSEERDYDLRIINEGGKIFSTTGSPVNANLQYDIFVCTYGSLVSKNNVSHLTLEVIETPTLEKCKLSARLDDKSYSDINGHIEVNYEDFNDIIYSFDSNNGIMEVNVNGFKLLKDTSSKWDASKIYKFVQLPLFTRLNVTTSYSRFDVFNTSLTEAQINSLSSLSNKVDIPQATDSSAFDVSDDMIEALGDFTIAYDEPEFNAYLGQIDMSTDEVNDILVDYFKENKLTEGLLVGSDLSIGSVLVYPNAIMSTSLKRKMENADYFPCSMEKNLVFFKSDLENFTEFSTESGDYFEAMNQKLYFTIEEDHFYFNKLPSIKFEFNKPYNLVGTYQSLMDSKFYINSTETPLNYTTNDSETFMIQEFLFGLNQFLLRPTSSMQYLIQSFKLYKETILTTNEIQNIRAQEIQQDDLNEIQVAIAKDNTKDLLQNMNNLRNEKTQIENQLSEMETTHTTLQEQHTTMTGDFLSYLKREFARITNLESKYKTNLSKAKSKYHKIKKINVVLFIFTITFCVIFLLSFLRFLRKGRKKSGNFSQSSNSGSSWLDVSNNSPAKNSFDFILNKNQ